MSIEINANAGTTYLHRPARVCGGQHQVELFVSNLERMHKLDTRSITLLGNIGTKLGYAVFDIMYFLHTILNN
jgi:hypothetical protein